MKTLILAAGYATRLYPLTRTFPKPLLAVQGKTILDRLIDDADTIAAVDEHIIVSNQRFYDQFLSWGAQKKCRAKITVLNDRSTENENRLGAVKDIAFAIQLRDPHDDIMVLAGDNVLDFSLSAFVAYQQKKNATCIMRHYEPSEEKLRRTGVLTVALDDRVLEMQEKPVAPKSHWACPPFYIYTAQDVPLIVQAVQQNACNTDAPGDFIAWFCTQRPVYAWEMTGKRYDIGTLASYEEAQRIALP